MTHQAAMATTQRSTMMSPLLLLLTTAVLSASRCCAWHSALRPFASCPLRVSTDLAGEGADSVPSQDSNHFAQRKTVGTLGDIMSTSPDAGLVTSEEHSLAETYGIQHPLDRMIITANGNLQRLVASYYDSPVHVQVDYSRPNTDRLDTSLPSTSSSSLPRLYDRQVSLLVHDTVFCTAKSTVQVHSDVCAHLVQSGQVGLGQLFRHLDVLPEFELHSAGYDAQSALWRKYTLYHPKYVTCYIEERFCPDVWNVVAADRGGGGVDEV